MLRCRKMVASKKIWTILDILQWSKPFLQEKGSVNPKGEAELLLMAVLGLERMDLYVQFDRPLSSNEKNLYRSYILRRAKQEPVQQITGFAYFMGLRFEVTPDVLIPRFDTETMIETVVKRYNVSGCSGREILLLDVGTGSGAIAVSLAKLLPELKVMALDIDPKALRVANKNALINDVAERIEFVNSDLLSELIHRKFDQEVWLVSNPPYISEAEYYQLDAEVRDFEPKQALLAKENGLEFYRKIISQSSIFGESLGALFFEVGYNQSKDVSQMLSDRFGSVNVAKDLGGIERVVYTCDC